MPIISLIKINLFIPNKCGCKLHKQSAVVASIISKSVVALPLTTTRWTVLKQIQIVAPLFIRKICDLHLLNLKMMKQYFTINAAKPPNYYDSKVIKGVLVEDVYGNC